MLSRLFSTRRQCLRRAVNFRAHHPSSPALAATIHRSFLSETTRRPHSPSCFLPRQRRFNHTNQNGHSTGDSNIDEDSASKIVHRLRLLQFLKDMAFVSTFCWIIMCFFEQRDKKRMQDEIRRLRAQLHDALATEAKE